jgi:hypothetical protein
MKLFVAVCTKGDQVFFGVVSQLASEADMVNLEIERATASLAVPTVSRQDPLAKPLIGLKVQPETRLLRAEFPHEGAPICSENLCFSV